MARGNQRDKAREKNLKAAAGTKAKNTQSGTEFARTKEDQAAIMRAKQAAGMSSCIHNVLLLSNDICFVCYCGLPGC
ncbi:hypothetical protein NX059_008788 [Plenodomus lindquistii]|nr:hypothetical protein NX059_008788 [Plenodomus lindquistii]